MKTPFARLLLCLSFCLLTAGAGVSAQPMSVPSSHPYLYADKAGFRSLARAKDATLVELREVVIAEADKAAALMQDYQAEPSPSFGIIRSAQGRLLNLCAAYNLTGDKKYIAPAKRQLDIFLGWGDWGTYHFLDVGEASLAVGVAYDWLYPVLTREERAATEQALMDKAFAPSLLVTDESDSWLKGNFNWNQVCHGGLVVAALAVFDIYPDVCRRIVERAAECVPYATAVYAPDGAFPEGPSYWEYGTSYQVYMMEAMRSALGHCFGLEKYDGFLKTADYRLQVCGNTGLEYSYSDYHKSMLNEPVMMWFGRELGRYDLQSGELDKVHKVLAAGKGLSRHTVFDLLWWACLEPQEASARSGLSGWFAKGRMPLAIMRTDKLHNDAYAAFKGGTANHSHGHMDSGSFIYESRGVRWAIDPGTESYDKMRAAGLDLWNYQPQGTRWTTFRPSSEAHNVLRINGAPLLSTAVASDMSFSESAGSCSATLNTTPLYATVPVSSVLRTVTMGEDGNLTVCDEVAASKDIVLSFQWLTDAVPAVDGRSVTLTKDGVSIVLTAPEADFVHIDDVSHMPGVQNSPNPGVSRILFLKKVKAGTTARLSIEATNR